MTGASQSSNDIRTRDPVRDPAHDPAREPVIEARGITKVYGESTVVDRVDVRVERGECWGLLGPNGAGKSTFLRMLIGRTPATRGQLAVLGLPVPSRASEVRARVGVVPQEDTLDPDFTVRENLRVYATYFGLEGRDVDDRISELLEFAELSAKAGDGISTLSGGMRRRLSLCRALVNDPELVILDEPTTGLDPQARQLLWQRLRSLTARGITLVLTTHYMDEAQRLCDRVTIMDHGRLLDSDPPARLVARHIEPHVVEVHGPHAQAFHDETGAALAIRSERVGETFFYYADDERPLLEALHERPALVSLHRPATLEDIFLKLTGRDLRDG